MTQMESQLSYGWTTFETHLQQLDAMMKERDAEILKFQEVFVFSFIFISIFYRFQQNMHNSNVHLMIWNDDCWTHRIGVFFIFNVYNLKIILNFVIFCRCVMLETAHSQTVCCIFYYFFKLNVIVICLKAEKLALCETELRHVRVEQEDLLVLLADQDSKLRAYRKRLQDIGLLLMF
jgi:hypothetical protein